MDVNENWLDPRWRLNNLYYIQNKDGKKVLFNENPLQAKINNDPTLWKRVLKSRQIGFSTNFLLQMFDFAIFNENKNCFCIAHEDKSIRKLFRIVSRAHKWLDPDIRPALGKGGGSRYEYHFPDIESRIGVGLASRGDTIHWLHISEAAFCDPDRIKATLETVPKGARITFETTPHGMGNHFYDDWVSESRFKNFFYPWFEMDEYQNITRKINRTDEEKEFAAKVKKNFKIKITDSQLAWRRMKQQDLKELFPQEYPEDDVSCFLASGNPAFDLIKIKSLLDNITKPLSDDGLTKIYQPYNKELTYVCGADTAEGVNGDYSVGCMYRLDTREQVAIIRGRIPPSDFAHHLKVLCNKYTSGERMPPLLGVERNNHGHAVLLELKEHIHYPNLYKTKDGKVGWLTDRVTRPIMIDAFIDGVTNSNVILNDSDTLKECLTLVVNNGKIEAAENKHDDCIIAAAIGLQMIIANRSEVYKDIGKKIFI